MRTEPDAKPTWGHAFAWAVPMGLWAALLVGSALWLPATAWWWFGEHLDWLRTIEASQERGDADTVAGQTETLHGIDRTYALELLALAAGLALAIGLRKLYRTHVPPSRRGGLRALVMGLVFDALLALAGAMVLMEAMRGAITG